MWHASYSSHLTLPSGHLDQLAKTRLAGILEGVGDREHEWREPSLYCDRIRQVRRRMTRAEREACPLRNLRGTDEALERVRAVARASGFAYADLLKIEPEILDPKCSIYQPDRLFRLEQAVSQKD